MYEYENNNNNNNNSIYIMVHYILYIYFIYIMGYYKGFRSIDNLYLVRDNIREMMIIIYFYTYH